MPSRLILSFEDRLNKRNDKDQINLELIKSFAENKILYNGSIFICKTHTNENLEYFNEIFSLSINKIKKKFNL